MIRRGGGLITVAIVAMVGVPIAAVVLWALTQMPSLPTWVKLCLSSALFGGFGLLLGYLAGSAGGNTEEWDEMPVPTHRGGRARAHGQSHLPVPTYVPPIPPAERARLRAQYPGADVDALWVMLNSQR